MRKEQSLLATQDALSRRNFLRHSAFILAGSLFTPSLFARPRRSITYVERAAFTMGSIVTIKAYTDDEKECLRGIDEAFREMKEIDRLMSVFDERSQLSLVNHHSHEREIVVDERIIEVLTRAKEYSALTNEAFDVTVEPLMELYGFRDEAAAHSFPSDRQIAETLESVGMRNVTLDSRLSTVLLRHPKTRLDFGGIAVGYAIDRSVSILKSHGVTSALINHSGDLFAIGSPPEEDAWDVGIVDPMHPDSIITTLQIRDEALSTSGNYEKFIEADGRTIGHLLDPHSGKSPSTILSGTVIAPTAIEADALSTGLFVMGIEQQDQLIKRSHNLRFVGVTKNGQNVEVTRISSG